MNRNGIRSIELTGGLPFEVKLPVSERVLIRSKEDLYRKLDEAEEDIRLDKTSD